MRELRSHGASIACTRGLLVCSRLKARWSRRKANQHRARSKQAAQISVDPCRRSKVRLHHLPFTTPRIPPPLRKKNTRAALPTQQHGRAASHGVGRQRWRGSTLTAQCRPCTPLTFPRTIILPLTNLPNRVARMLCNPSAPYLSLKSSHVTPDVVDCVRAILYSAIPLFS